MSRAAVCLWLFVFAAACGGGETRARDAHAKTRAPTTGPAETKTRVSRVLEAVRDGATHGGFVALKRMRESGWLLVVKKALGMFPDPRLQERVLDLYVKCGTDPVAVLDELAWSGTSDELLLVGKLAIPAASAVSCARGIAESGEGVEVRGISAWRVGSLILLAHDDHLVLGSRNWVEAFVDRRDAPSVLRDRVMPTDRTMVRFDANFDDQTSARGSIESSSAEMSAEFDITLANEKRAIEFETDIQRARQDAAENIPAQLPLPVVVRKKNSVRIALTTEGDLPEQGVALVGVVSSIAIRGVNRYLAATKAAEAKNTVGTIARGLAIAAEREDESGAKTVHRFPPSAPAIPIHPPRGMKYRSAAREWEHPSWKAIRFSMSWPQYYSYSFETSKDRKRCVVIARGDLDGDGIESKFTRTLTVDDRGVVQIAPEMTVENEYE